MRKFLTLTFVVAVLGLAACSNDKKTNEEIDSLNKVSADSLLNAALADTTSVSDSLATDSLVVDSTISK
jgi:hypothetical protein